MNTCPLGLVIGKILLKLQTFPQRKGWIFLRGKDSVTTSVAQGQSGYYPPKSTKSENEKDVRSCRGPTGRAQAL